jgi:hydrogenase maturation protein HypF
LGDLESFETQENYQKLNQHFLNLFQTQPGLIVVDTHPAYFSTQLGKILAEEAQIPIQFIQHHIAHFGAVLAENNLLESQEKILGVIWDGTGLGDDGQIWGGEFFTYQNQTFERNAHFPYFPMILGDKMPREPRISALCVFNQFENAIKIVENKFTKTEWQIYQQLLSKNTLKTSSVGRLFDAVASLLGVMDKATYEGEAAMRLESLAYQYFKKNQAIKLNLTENISSEIILKNLIQAILAKKDLTYLAFKFHLDLVTLIENQAKSLNINKIAFSGGVFQNSLLVTLIKQYLSKDFELFFHRQLSPNDENIAFGQMVLGQENYLIH